MDHFDLTLNLNVGKRGVDDDPLNPLSRAFRGILEQGAPYKGHSYCFYSREVQGLFSKRELRWLGVFLLSAGDRILFFPGLSLSTEWIDTTTAGDTGPRQSFEIDHVSLEPNRKRWHFTTLKSQNHYSGGRTPDAGNENLLWFGLSLSSENILREVSRSTKIQYSSSTSDSTRRVELIRNIETTASSNYISLMSNRREKNSPGFLHFTFVVGPRGTANYNGPDWLLPSGSPKLLHPLPDKISNVSIQIHRIELASNYDIQIASMWLPGQITTPTIYTTHASLHH